LAAPDPAHAGELDPSTSHGQAPPAEHESVRDRDGVMLVGITGGERGTGAPAAAGAEGVRLAGPPSPALSRLALSAATLRKLSRNVLDGTAIVLALLVSARGRWPGDPVTAIVLLVVYPVAVRTMLSRKAGMWDDGSLIDELRHLAGATSVPALASIGAAAILRGSADVELGLRMWVFTLALLVIGRIVFHYIQGTAPEATSSRTLIVGAGRVGADLARLLRAEPQHGLAPVGFLDYGPAPRQAKLAPRNGVAQGPQLPVLGAPEALPGAITATGADCVVFAFTTSSDERLLPLVEQCERSGVRAFVVPRLFEAVGWRMEVRQIGSLPLSELRAVDPRDVRFAIKHLLDRLIAGLALLALAPLLLAVSALVKSGSDGPALFRQRRIGRDGCEFTMLKFRTMHQPHELEARYEPSPGYAPGGVEFVDRRTGLGRWLRRTSIDELPQLINVLRGEMSLIGPRPERPEYVRQFAAELRRYDRRHRVKSGITGLAQVTGLRGQTPILERAEYDNFYVQNWSFWLDLKIALRTIKAVLAPNGE
jgi:exopolysaccharide biosynthesis polyprenyl glycosylphosphotransferase